MNSPPSPSLTILIADDSPAHRSVIKVFLSKRDFRFLDANNGEEALKILELEHVDLLIADLKMPKLDGFGLLDSLRGHSDYRLRQLPIIVLSGDVRIQSVPGKLPSPHVARANLRAIMPMLAMRISASEKIGCRS